MTYSSKFEPPNAESNGLIKLLKEHYTAMLEQCDRYEFIRKLSPQQFGKLNDRCAMQGLRFDDEVLRLARVWQEEKRIDL